MKTTTVTRIEWVRTWNNSNNAAGPWVGSGATADYRIDHGDGWAGLTVYCNGDHDYGYRVFGSVKAAKAATNAIERKRQQKALECPACGDTMDEGHDNLRPTWSDTHDNEVCWWCAMHNEEVAL